MQKSDIVGTFQRTHGYISAAQDKVLSNRPSASLFKRELARLLDAGAQLERLIKDDIEESLTKARKEVTAQKERVEDVEDQIGQAVKKASTGGRRV